MLNIFFFLKKTRTDTKQLTKDIKSSKPSVNTTTTANPGQQIPIIQNAQSPLSRTIKTPVPNTVNNATTVTNGYNVVRPTQNSKETGKQKFFK